MDGLTELGAFIAIVAVATVAGIRLGMLLAPSIDRLTERTEEEPDADDD